MKILIEVEPVLCKGSITGETYYAFRIVGLGNAAAQVGAPLVGADLVMASSCSNYPGNYAVRTFINAAKKAE